MNKKETLGEGEVLLHGVRRSYEEPKITLADGTVLTVKKQVDEMMGSGDAAMDIIPSVFLVVNDMEAIASSINSEFTNKEYFCRPTLSYGFDTGLEKNEQIRLAEVIREYVRDLDISGEGGFYSYSVECREAERDEFYGTFGGIFYLGIILSIVFILATVLIIYYKQVTEGYEDQSRFAIMQKVGMTKKDIRKSINSQILMVFFLPLITAGIHVLFAFSFIFRIMMLMGLFNMKLYALCTAGCFLAFGVFYTVVYLLTARMYYGIVKK